MVVCLLSILGDAEHDRVVVTFVVDVNGGIITKLRRESVVDGQSSSDRIDVKIRRRNDVTLAIFVIHSSTSS